MIKLEQISKSFVTEDVETTALDSLDLTVTENEFLAIMGPSGCGKSTLLNILGMLDVPSSGRQYFLGQDITDLSERQRSEIRKDNIGFIFQEFNLINELTVYQNVELALLYKGVSAAQRRKAVEDMLEQMSMSHRKNHFPKKLSGGQQQRVAIARALVSKPKLVLADEPTGNLDSKLGAEVIEILASLKKTDTTVVMVTHSENHASYADRVIELLDGKPVPMEKSQNFNVVNG